MTNKHKDKQRQTKTNKDKHKQKQAKTKKDKQGKAQRVNQKRCEYETHKIKDTYKWNEKRKCFQY